MESISTSHKILLIEDSPEDRQMYRRLIIRGREQDYQFREAGSGEDGLRLYGTEPPDCVVLDYSLPDLNGLEFLTRLQSEHEEGPIPVIMLTGQGSEVVAVRALKLGAQDYLLKSRAAECLKYTVHAVIEKVALFRRIKEQRRELEQVVRALRENEERYRLLGSRTLRESEERYRLLLEGLVDYAIVMLDAEGRIVSWNAGAERLLGYRAEEVIGKDVSCLYAPEEARSCQPHRVLQFAAGAGRSVIEAKQLRKDGSRFLAYLTVTALRDESGTLWGFAQVAREITEGARDAG